MLGVGRVVRRNSEYVLRRAGQFRNRIGGIRNIIDGFDGGVVGAGDDILQRVGVRARNRSPSQKDLGRRRFIIPRLVVRNELRRGRYGIGKDFELFAGMPRVFYILGEDALVRRVGFAHGGVRIVALRIDKRVDAGLVLTHRFFERLRIADILAVLLAKPRAFVMVRRRAAREMRGTGVPVGVPVRDRTEFPRRRIENVVEDSARVALREDARHVALLNLEERVADRNCGDFLLVPAAQSIVEVRRLVVLAVSVIFRVEEQVRIRRHKTGKLGEGRGQVGAGRSLNRRAEFRRIGQIRRRKAITGLAVV